MTATFADEETPSMVHIKGYLTWTDDHDWGQELPQPKARYDRETHELVTYGLVWEGCDWVRVEVRHKSAKELLKWAGYH